MHNSIDFDTASGLVVVFASVTSVLAAIESRKSRKSERPIIQRKTPSMDWKQEFRTIVRDVRAIPAMILDDLSRLARSVNRSSFDDLDRRSKEHTTEASTAAPVRQSV